MIAHYAEARHLSALPPPKAAQMRLSALMARLSQVTSDLTVQRQRRSATRDQQSVESLNEVIALLVRQSRTLEGEIASMIDDDPLWACLNQAFRSIKGVANRTVARLMAELPEIGRISNKAIAKLAGLALIANDSGKRSGHRPVRGGRSGPRAILFLVGAIAARHDPHLAAFQQRLQSAGKRSSGSRLPESCWSFSMHKRAMREKNSNMQRDSPDNRSSPNISSRATGRVFRAMCHVIVWEEVSALGKEIPRRSGVAVYSRLTASNQSTK